MDGAARGGDRRAFWGRMAFCLFTGFSSGMPLYVLTQLLPGWLRTEDVPLSRIGLFGLATLPYTWKFAWAPLADRYVPPLLGRRRGWALPTQLALLAALAALGAAAPARSLTPVAVLAALVALASATQDIVLDAWRREVLPERELGLGNSLFVNAYRLSSLVPGALAFLLADHLPWSTVFPVVAAWMGIGIATTLLAPEPAEVEPPPRGLVEAVVGPFAEFFGRAGRGPALWTLAFVVLYKLGDSMATALATPFYLDLGFSLTEIGTVAKLSALWASVAGGLLGGAWMLRLGIDRALWVFGAVQLLTILGFAALSEIGPSTWALATAVSLEYLGVGMGTTAFVAFIARESSTRFTATQFALLTGLAGIPRTLATAASGFLVERLGYTAFFLLCTALALPGMVLLLRVAPWRPPPSAR